MRYDYHDLSTDDFEALVAAICVKLLGPSLQPFSSGPDGGRDARFSGNPECFQYSGIFVIQAKHTENPCAKFGDPEFCGSSSSSILSKEIPKINELAKKNELDFYFVFSNRRLSAGTDEHIRARITEETAAKEVEVFGIERIDQLLRTFPEIANISNLHQLGAPLRPTPDDLAEVIISLASNKKALKDAKKDIGDLERHQFEKKNKQTGLSAELAQKIIADYIDQFDYVKQFLALPENSLICERYDEAALEFDELLIVFSQESDSCFDLVLINLQRRLFERDPDLSRNKRLTKLIIYYMYWNCDLASSYRE